MMKRHSDTPLNTTCTAKPRLRQIAALSAGKQHALRFAAAHHALNFDERRQPQVSEQMRCGIDGCLLMGKAAALAAPIEAATK